MTPQRRSVALPTAASAPCRGLTVLVAVLTLVTLELVRSSGPLLDMAFSQGVMSAAGAALATYLLPGLLAPVLLLAGRRLGPLGPVAVGTAALAVARLVVQGLTAGARFGVGLATVALGVAVLMFAVTALAGLAGGRHAAAALATGFAGSVGLQLALGTWDAYWRHDVLGWSVTAAVVAGLVVAAAAAHREMPSTLATARAGRVWALGPALGLSAMVLANPAFAASQGRVPLAVAGSILGVAWLLAAADLARRPPALPAVWGRLGRVVDAVILPVLVGAMMLTTNPAALVMLVALPLGAAGVLARALEPTRAAPAGRWRTAGTAGTAGTAMLVGLGTILPLLVYQLDYDVPLGFPNSLVLVAAAAVLVAAGVRTRTAGDRTPAVGATPRETPAEEGAPSVDEEAPVDAPFPADGAPASRAPHPVRWTLAAAGVLLLVGTGLAGVRAVSTARSSELTPEMDLADQVTLVSWNLHYGVDPAGDVDLEQIARTIEAEHPSVVTLQEVSRGWVMGGGADMATWLADRLGMRMSFAPAADGQFGNVVLTDLPHDEVTVLELPYGAGPQRRSALSVDVLIAGGPLRVTSVHVQHREENTDTRLDQIRTLLEAEGGAPAGIVAGDFNAEPGWPEIELMTGEAGYVSAVDVSGDASALTSPSIDPQQRIDWVFGRGVTFLGAEVLGDALSSDHLPLVVVLRVGAPAEG